MNMSLSNFAHNKKMQTAAAKAAPLVRALCVVNGAIRISDFSSTYVITNN